MESRWDCIVVGGGAAGLSAALVLGRARKRTLVVDGGRQSNHGSPGVGGLLGQDGRPPTELYEDARRELAEYPAVELRAGEVEGAEPERGGFAVEISGGGRERARRLLLATGAEYRYPDVPGVAERWGRSAFHCPFCHGWEVRDRTLGVLDRGASAVGRALLLSGWSAEVTLFTNGPAELDEADVERLGEAGVPIDERRVSGLEGPGDELTAITFETGERRACDALLVGSTMHQGSVVARQLGLALVDEGPVIDAIEIDGGHLTSVDGVYAAGDATPQMASVANAVAAGSTAAIHIVRSLMP